MRGEGMNHRIQLIRKKAKVVVERRDTAAGRWFDYVIQFLIVLSVGAFTVETLPGLDESTIRLLVGMESVLVYIFLAEYALRVWVSDSWGKYTLSFYGIVDLLSILPYFLMLGFDLRALRSLRFFRLFRLLKLARYNTAIKRLQIAFQMVKEELVLFLTMSIMVIYLSSVLIYYFENEAQPEAFASVFHAMWWAVATLTTVGYGDVYPITVAGKVCTFFILLVGLGVVAVPSGMFASALSEARRQVPSSSAGNQDQLNG